MWIVVIFAALVAAFLNAVGSLTQRRATGQIDVRQLFRHNILAQAFTNRLWLLGGGAQLGAFVAQALALHSGPLIVVAPLMTTDLVFLMLLLRAYYHTGIGRREWLGAAAVSGGLSLFLVSADPRGGNIPLQATPWIVTSVVIAVFVISGAIAMRRGPAPHWRAAIGGLTAGAHFALTAAYIKLVMEQLRFGVFNEFSGWPLWALAVAGITSLVSLQSMYGAGPLAISWPLVEITEAVGGVIIGLGLFGDTVSTSPLALCLQALGALGLLGGIILLAGSNRLRQSEETVS